MTDPDTYPDRYPRKQIYVYFNRKNNRFSVRCISTKKVLCRPEKLTLLDCKFVVNQGIYKRWLRNRQASVHAFVRGTWQPMTLNPAWFNWVQILYLPAEGRFVNALTRLPVTEAAIVECRIGGTIWAVLKVNIDDPDQ